MAEPKGKMTFYCPYCGEKFSFLDGTIVKLAGELDAEYFSCRTMFYIPAKLGQYGAIVGGEVAIREGAKVEFHCINPKCNRNLTAAYNDALAEIRMRDEAGSEFVIIFNKIWGKRSTFVVDYEERRLVQSFGEHAETFSPDFEKPVNFFGA